MRKKYFLFNLVIILLLNYIIFTLFSLSTMEKKKTEESLEYRRVALHEITFVEPAGQHTKEWRDNRKNWDNTYYKILSVGTLQISTKEFKKEYDFYTLISRFLRVEISPSVDEKFYFSRGLYYKRVLFDKNGAFILKKNKRGIAYIYAFSVSKRFYWFSFYPDKTFSIYMNVFLRVIGSIRGLRPGLKSNLKEESLRKELKLVCLKSYFMICQNFFILIGVITFLIVTVGLGFFSIISHFSGKLPENVKASSQYTYKEENVDMVFKTWFTMKFYTTSIALDGKNLYIFKFRKLFAEIPLISEEILIEKKSSMFYGEHIEIVLRNSQHIKDKYLQGLSLLKKVKITIKLFPSETDKFFFALKTFRV